MQRTAGNRAALRVFRSVDWSEQRLEDLFAMWVEGRESRAKVKYEVRRRLDWKVRRGRTDTLAWFLDNNENVRHPRGEWLRAAIRYRLRRAEEVESGGPRDAGAGPAGGPLPGGTRRPAEGTGDAGTSNGPGETEPAPGYIQGDEARERALAYVQGIHDLEEARDAAHALLQAQRRHGGAVLERYHVHLAGLPSQGVLLDADAFAQVAARVRRRLVQLYVRQRGPSFRGLRPSLGEGGVARLERLRDEYWGRYRVRVADDASDDLAFVRGLPDRVDPAELDEISGESLRQLARWMSRAIFAWVTRDQPMITEQGGSTTRQDPMAVSLEALSAIRGGPFAAIFYSVTYLRTDDTEKAAAAARLGEHFDTLLTSAGTAARTRTGGRDVSPSDYGGRPSPTRPAPL